MSAIKKILVAVKNPDARRQPGVDKAIGIARQLGASVELFNAISTPVFLDLQPLTGHTRGGDQARSAAAAAQAAGEDRGARAQARRQDDLQRGVGLSAARGHRAPRAALRRRSHHRRVPPGPATEALARTPDRLGAAANQPAAGAAAEERATRGASPPSWRPSIRPTRTTSRPDSTPPSSPRPAHLARELHGSFELMHAIFPTGFGADVRRSGHRRPDPRGRLRAAEDAQPRQVRSLRRQGAHSACLASAGGQRPRVRHSARGKEDRRGSRGHGRGIAFGSEARIHRQHGRTRARRPALRRAGDETREFRTARGRAGARHAIRRTAAARAMPF